MPVKLRPRGGYRLPSESEWEYAAGVGTITRFFWRDEDASAYDIFGNVSQWTEDCYAEITPVRPPTAARQPGRRTACASTAVASWFYPAWLLRPATRERNPAGYRDTVMGFRLAKTLP